MAPLFGRSKSARKAAEGADAGAADGAAEVKITRSKSFKRIRGLLKGVSRKERKARREAEKAVKDGNAASAQPDEEDEASTVFGVDVDDRSVVTGAASTAANFLKNESVLEEKKSEDSKKAFILKVVLLLMDPETRRFELLQLEFDSLKALVSDVLAQIPISVTEEALRMQTYTGISGKDGIEMAPDKLLATFCKGNEVLVAIPDGVPAKECARLARPILSDEKVINMLASSGIDASGWKEEPKKKKKKPALKTATRAVPESAVAEPLEHEKKGSNKMFTVIFIILLALLLQVFHVYISAPINPGSTISPGVWLSKCGLLTVLPSCENAYLHFNREGVVTHYNAAKQVTWKMEGAVCDVDDELCVKGMQIQEDGKVVIGGKHVTYVTSFVKDVNLSPWPFVETPKLKVWRK